MGTETEVAAPHTGAVVETPRAIAKANGQRLPAMGFTPQSPDEAFRLANMLSESGLIPEALRGRPKDVLVVLMTGRELGLEPMQSLRMLHVINGKAGMAAELIVAKILQSGLAEYFTLVNSTAKVATYKTKRVGTPDAVTLSFTWEQAVNAGLTEGKQGATWKAYPDAKLRARASSHLGRAVYPDVTNGLHDLDELREVAREVESTPYDATTGEVVEAPKSRVAQLAAQVKAAAPAPTPPGSTTVDAPKVDAKPAEPAIATELSDQVPKFSAHAGKRFGELSTAQLREIEGEAKAAIEKKPSSETAAKVAIWLGGLRREIENREAALAAETAAGRAPGEEG